MTDTARRILSYVPHGAPLYANGAVMHADVWRWRLGAGADTRAGSAALADLAAARQGDGAS